jgi:hypothetical protein
VLFAVHPPLQGKGLEFGAHVIEGADEAADPGKEGLVGERPRHGLGNPEVDDVGRRLAIDLRH